MSQNNQKQFKTFEDFTNLYELSKTLRFELKPMTETKDLLIKNKIYQKDEKIAENYEKIKNYFDRLHRKFIDESLKDAQINYKTFFDLWQKEKNNKTLNNEAKRLRGEIKKLFDEKAKKWKDNLKKKEIKIKNSDLKILFEKDILDVLKEEFKDKNADIKNIEGKKENLFESFKGFFTYFTNFNESRKNFYKDDGTSTAVATRVIDENLKRFCDNILVFRHIKNKIDFTADEKKIFEIDYYNSCLPQSGIDKYNKITGDLNSKINKYRQDTDEKVPFLKILYKQILGEPEKQKNQNDVFIEVNNDQEVFKVLQDFVKHGEDKNAAFCEIFKNFIDNLNNYDLNKIYLAKRFINTISSKWFSLWYVFGAELKEKTGAGKKKELPEFIPFIKIKEMLECTAIDQNELFKKKFIDEKKVDLSKNAYENFLNLWKDEFDENIKKYNENLEKIEKMIKEDKQYTNKIITEKDEKIEIQKQIIKNYADSALAIYQMMKYFLLEKNGKRIENLDTDDSFYNSLNKSFENIKTFSYYNEFRNYLTKKPFSTEKTKLNFGSGQFLGGFDKNKESEKLGVILRKNGLYYLAVLTQGHNKIFDETKNPQAFKISGEYYEKMEYKLFPDAKRMIPKIAFAKNNKEKFGWSREIQNIKDEFALFQERKKKDKTLWNKKFDKKKTARLIEYYQQCLERGEYKKIFNLDCKKPAEYASIGEFNNDIDRQSYRINFIPVDEKYINEKMKNGQIYLFQIYGKDFSKETSGKENLHTTYFKLMFDDTNLKNQNGTVIKLSGGAEMFYRPASYKKETEKRGGKNREIVKYKRYTEDKIFLHLPLVLNFCNNNSYRLNNEINELLSKNKDINIIGIDRGEKHLAYYSVINQSGDILESGSFNKLKLGGREVDYLKLLEDKANKRDKERKEWQTIENIKELKTGYISQVVKKICDLIIEYNAIVVFEDLNIGFKRGRQKIEKQIYQKLELALVNKLNYLVNKSAKKQEAGHFLSAYQLTPLIKTYKDAGKQTGIVFYTQAGYTSLTCPCCGFRRNTGFTFKNKRDANNQIENLRIDFEPEKDRFKIEYQVEPTNNKNGKKKKDKTNELFINIPQKKNFTVYSDVKRVRWHNKDTERAKNDGEGEIKQTFDKGVVKEYDINKNLKDLLGAKIDLSAGNITDRIVEGNFENGFYKDLFYYLNILLLTRNSISGTDTDYIQCPACGFHSDNKFKGKEYNGDANGAYNIARKGILILEKIRQFKKDNGDELNKLKWGDLAVNINEWDKYTQTIKPNKA